MANLRFLLLALLFAGVSQIKSEETEAAAEDDIAELFKDMPELGPRVDLKYLPELSLPDKPPIVAGFKGQILTPNDGCGVSKEMAGRIVGGTPAKPGQYPWMVLLGYSVWDTEISFNCGGSLITSRHVLTAAHCLNHYLYMVRLGEHDYSSQSNSARQDIRISQAIPHALYDKRLLINDIAILHLNRDARFNDRVRPVCLPVDENMQQTSFLRTNPFVAGWGATRENGRVSSQLLHVQVPVISNAECREKYRAIGALQAEKQFDKYVICAGHTYGGKDSCQGDSGGPLMLPVHQNGKFPFYQIGVVSYGIGCARRNVPGVYTNVQHYAEWIKQNAKFSRF